MTTAAGPTFSPRSWPTPEGIAGFASAPSVLTGAVPCAASPRLLRPAVERPRLDRQVLLEHADHPPVGFGDDECRRPVLLLLCEAGRTAGLASLAFAGEVEPDADLEQLQRRHEPRRRRPA